MCCMTTKTIESRHVQISLECFLKEGLRKHLNHNQGGLWVWTGLSPLLPLIPRFGKKAVNKSKRC